MKMRNIFVLLLVLAVAFPVFARGAQDGSTRPQVFSLATAGLGGTYYIVGAGLAEAITQRVGPLTVNAIIAPGSAGNPLMLDRHEAELGITNYFSGSNAIHGRPPFEHRIPIAGIAPLQFSTLHIMVMANRTDLRTFADLRGARVNLGPAGGGGATFFNELLPFWGLSPSDFNFSYLSYTEGTDALRDGRIDVNTPNGAFPLETVSSIAAFDNIRLISLEAENMARVHAANPYYNIAPIPGGTYRGIDETVYTGGIQDILIVRQDMDEELAYQITRAIYEALAEIRLVHPSVSHMSFDNYNHSLVPLHPGALRFYRERGIPIQ